LTFNTTSLPLARALRHKLLLVRQPLRPLTQDAKRFLLVTPEIDALLDGHLKFGEFPAREAEIVIGRFVAGHLMRVSQKFTKNNPDVEKIVGANEVWAVCLRRPSPGWRLLGRWYEEPSQHVFVALRAWDKIKLFPQYGEAANEVIDDWTELFGATAPRAAVNLGDYVGGVFSDVD
jgi:hypothetical protein